MDEKLLFDTSKTAKELAELFGCFWTTINRKRKKLGIKVPKGSKKGKPKPFNMTGETVSCETCGKPFYKKPSRPNMKTCSKKCLFENKNYLEKLKNIDRSYMQTEAYRNTLRKEHTPEYIRYKNRVTKLTEQTYQKHIDILNPNRYPRTLAGVEGGYHLDHIIPVKYAFDNNWKPEKVAKLENLQILPWRENIQKGNKICGGL